MFTTGEVVLLFLLLIAFTAVVFLAGCAIAGASALLWAILIEDDRSNISEKIVGTQVTLAASALVLWFSWLTTSWLWDAMKALAEP